MTKFGLAQNVRRVEDPRLLKGSGRYTDDFNPPGTLHGIVLRSPHANAGIVAIETAAALDVPGVLAVYTGEDLEKDGIGGMPCAIPLIQGGVPPPKWNRYSQAMKPRPRFTASPVISSRMRRSAASSQAASRRSQKPWRWFAFLKVDSGGSWSPSPAKYWKRISLPLKLTWSPTPG